MRAWRWPIRLAIPALVIAGLVVDDRLDRDDAATETGLGVRTELQVPAAEDLSSTWLCPAVHLRRVQDRGVDATATLALTNTTTLPTRARVELMSATSTSRVIEVEVAAQSTTDVSIDPDPVDELVAALVESPNGGLVVDRRFSSEFGTDSARCSDQPFDRWFLPTGDTQRDATNEVIVFNPLPSDAVIDMSFATEAETGAFVAVDLEGLVVPPRTSIRLDLGEYVRRRDLVATSIEVRAGRVVVDQFQVYDGSVGRVGFSAELATATTAERWLFPSGRLDAEQRMELAIMNPSDDVAEVDVAAVSAAGGGDPVALTIGPREVVLVPIEVFTDEAPSVPTIEVSTDVDFGLIVESANGVPVVAAVEASRGPSAAPADDLETDDEQAPADEDDAAPTTTVVVDPGEDPESVTSSGVSLLTAIPEPAASWLIVVPADATAAVLSLQTPDSEARVVTVSELSGRGVEVLEVGGFQVESLTVASGLTLVIESDGPIAVSLLGRGDQGLGLLGVLPVEF